MIRFTQMKCSFVTIADSGPLMRRPTCITWKFARFRHSERKLRPARPKPREDISINASGSPLHARTRTPKAEQNASSGYWSRISKIAREIIVELGKNSKIGNYEVHTAQPRPAHGINAGESLIDKQGHRKTTSRIADPYGLITRWKTRIENNSPQPLTSNR
jgi:hypothetical protein